MTTEERTITLGDEVFEIAPIDLGTMKLIGLGSAKMQGAPTDPVAKEAAWYDGTFEVLAAATKASPDETIKDGITRVSAIKNVTLQQLTIANRKIFLLTGLVVSKEGSSPVTPGEG